MSRGLLGRVPWVAVVFVLLAAYPLVPGLNEGQSLPELARRIVEACLEACRTCGEECERHAHHHEHCRVCAEACHRCEQACQDALAALPF